MRVLIETLQKKTGQPPGDGLCRQAEYDKKTTRWNHPDHGFQAAENDSPEGTVLVTSRVSSAGAASSSLTSCAYVSAFFFVSF
jgi:hypothetical protein